MVVTTEEYGKLWLSLSHDVKQNLKLLTDAGDPLRTTLNALKDALKLHVVDIIGKKYSLQFTYFNVICSHFAFHFKHAPSLTTHQSCVVVSGSEGIVACRLLSGAPCLLHCRVNGTALTMWLRSPHPALPDCIMYHCQRALAQH